MEYGSKLSPKLTSEQKYELLQLLFDYKHVFAQSLKAIKQYPHYESDIELTSNRKSFQLQFRLHPLDAETAQK